VEAWGERETGLLSLSSAHVSKYGYVYVLSGEMKSLSRTAR
jgi:hypothetical protein